MNSQTTTPVAVTPYRHWVKKLSWALPLFFMVKGLLWLTIPFVSAFYMIE